MPRAPSSSRQVAQPVGVVIRGARGLSSGPRRHGHPLYRVRLIVSVAVLAMPFAVAVITADVFDGAKGVETVNVAEVGPAGP